MRRTIAVVAMAVALFPLSAWAESEFTPLLKVQAHRTAISALAFSPDGSLVATGSAPGGAGNVIVWNLETGRIFDVFGGYDYGVISLEFSVDSNLLAVGHSSPGLFPPQSNGETDLWDLNRGVVRGQIRGAHALFSADGDYVVSAGGGRSPVIEVVSLSDGEYVDRIDNGPGIITDMAFSTGGDLLAVATTGRVVKVYRFPDGRLVHQLSGYVNNGSTVAFSPDGDFLAIGYGGIRGLDDFGGLVWDLKTGQSVSIIEGSYTALYDLDFSPDGRSMVAVGLDGPSTGFDPKVRFYNGKTGELVLAYHHLAHTVSYSPDSKMVALGGADGVLLIIADPTGQLDTPIFSEPVDSIDPRRGISPRRRGGAAGQPGGGLPYLIEEAGNSGQHLVLYPWIDEGAGQPEPISELRDVVDRRIIYPLIAGNPEIPFLMELVNDTERNLILYPWIAVEDVITGELVAVEQYEGFELAPYQGVRSDIMVIELPDNLEPGEYNVQAFLDDERARRVGYDSFRIELDRSNYRTVPQR